MTTSSTPNDQNKFKKNSILRSSLQDALAGATAGAIAKTATAPIERVKLIMQLRRSIIVDDTKIPSSSSNNHNNYSTMRNVVKSIYIEEGFAAFWRGNTPNVIRQGGAASLNFVLMDWYKLAIKPIINLSNSLPNSLREKRRKNISSFLSGGLAGGTTTTFLYPIEFIRTRLALDIGSTSSSIQNKKGIRKYPRGMRDVFCTTWKTDGIRGFYQGYGIALGGVVVYRALHLGGYEACKTELHYRRNENNYHTLTMSMWEKFAIAQIVSIVAGTICYPVDSVRRRLMMQVGQSHKMRLYKDSIHATRRIWIEEGIRGFYLGIGPNLVRSVGGALLLVSYDEFKSMLC